ncbi:hypothetical protein [Pantoea agglomerans]|uniref:hypothetical protein n=1 Tax=Enterobacter agglomerans TaxID=549 RepID=UPI003DA07F6C
MNKLTAEKCRERISSLKRNRRVFGLALDSEIYLQALEIALPILEQQESVKKLPLREGIEAIRKSTADSGGYDFNALREHQEMGEWIEWKGGAMPVSDKSWVDIRWIDGSFSRNTFAAIWDWEHRSGADNIIAYRIIPERATNQNGEQ